MHIRLFIPGPTEVSADTLKVVATPMIGHRAKEYSDLQGRVHDKLKKLLKTDHHVLLGTCSSTGWMEGAIRNCVLQRCANFVNGAFSERWHEITKACGAECDPINVEWGEGITPELVEKTLKTGKYDAVTIVHNESSTGVMSPLPEIAAMMKAKFPDVAVLIDMVSSMAGVDVNVKEYGLDVCLAGVQKAFSLPPGLAVAAISPKALERSKRAKGKGLYFDFVDCVKFNEKNQTPATPVISLIYALDYKLDQFFAEGLEKRFKRHQDMAEVCRAWAKRNFALFPKPGFESITITTVAKNKPVDMKALNGYLAKKGVVIADGYGKLKDTTFRIAHMGDTTVEELKQVLGWIDEYLSSQKK